jgi:endogenous inhibitor of DNA gyrase (YacG/DUF329 family)
MFFFVGGIQPKTVTVDRQPRSCPSCGHFGVYLKRVDHYVSLFFIPLFPVKRGTPFLICENCNALIDEHGARMDFEQPPVKKTCPACGGALDRDFTFCPYCGKAL